MGSIAGLVESSSDWRRDAAGLAVLGGAYWATAVLGLQWAAVGGAGSPVWPAAGVGLAGLLVGGARLWPAIVVGRLLAGVAVGSAQPFAVELAIAGANALATVLPVLALRRWGRPAWLAGTMRTAGGALARTGAMAAHALITAAIGTSVLAIANGLGPAAATAVGVGWWFGAFVGALTVLPVLMAWTDPAQWRRKPGEWLHLAACLAAVGAASAILFVSDAGLVLRTWAIFPVLVWAALAFGVPGAAPALLIASLSAIWGATIGVGPFTDMADAAAGRIALAQQFSALTGVTVLILAAVADERRTREALERSEARLNGMLEATTDSVFMLDREFRLTYLNANAVRTIAQGRDLVGQILWDAFPEAVGSAFWRAYTTAMRTGQATKADEFFPPLDTWFEANAYPSAEGLAVFFRDVTDQRRAAQRMAESEARMRAAQAIGGVLTWEWTIGTPTVAWSGPVDGMLGLPPDAQPDFAAFMDLVHPDDRARVLALVEPLTGACGIYEAEFRIRPPGGGQRWLAATGESVPGPDGRPAKLIGINYDVTERREAAEALARLNAELETRVAEDAAQLHQLQKLEGLGKLTGGVAHDFNNLLAAILSSLSSLRRHLPHGDARAERLLGNVEAAARRGAALTQRMLAFARRQDLAPRRSTSPSSSRACATSSTAHSGRASRWRRPSGPTCRRLW